MKIPVNFGGGSSGSDDVTATAAQVLSPYTAITSESEDEPQIGTMQDYGGATQSADSSLDTSNSRLRLKVPNEGRYNTSSYLYQTYSNIRSLIGYTDASKVLSGTTYLGLAGTMADRSGTTSSATSSLDSSNSRVRLQIPSNGYYNTSAYLYQSYSNIASLIGLTAAKIKYGETILGITGTWQGWVATSADIYYNGSVGSVCGSMGTYSSTYCTASANTNCILITQNASGSNTTTYSGGASFSTALNCAGYSKITMTYNVTRTSSPSSTGAVAGIGLFSSRPTSADSFRYTSALYYANASLSGTGSSRTVSIDISGISQNAYVAVYSQCPVSAPYWTIEVTRIALS